VGEALPLLPFPLGAAVDLRVGVGSGDLGSVKPLKFPCLTLFVEPTEWANVNFVYYYILLYSIF